MMFIYQTSRRDLPSTFTVKQNSEFKRYFPQSRELYIFISFFYTKYEYYTFLVYEALQYKDLNIWTQPVVSW
jgi:hypothetical protein